MENDKSSDSELEETAVTTEDEEQPIEESDEVEKREDTEEEAPPEDDIEEPRSRPRPKETEEHFVEERIYTIPLRRAWIAPPRQRASKAIRIIRAFVGKHMKVHEAAIIGEEEEEARRIIITNEVNEEVWNRGIEKPPRRLRVRAAKDEEGNVTVFLG